MYVSQLSFMAALDVLAGRESAPPPPPQRDGFIRWLDAAGFVRERMSPRQFDAVAKLYVEAHPGETVEGVVSDAASAEMWRGVTDTREPTEIITPRRAA